VDIPNDPGEPKYSQDCKGKYEYMPDGSWKAAGTCTDTYKSGVTKFETWEEGSDLKEYPYKVTGGTGKYQGASGGGTYFYENLTDTLAGGTYKGTLTLPRAAASADLSTQIRKSRSGRGEERTG
jgi:hypothetical protein